MTTTSTFNSKPEPDLIANLIRDYGPFSQEQTKALAIRAACVAVLLREIHEVTQSVVSIDHQLKAAMLTLGWDNPEKPQDHAELAAVLMEAFPDHPDVVAAKAGIEELDRHVRALLAGDQVAQ